MSRRLSRFAILLASVSASTGCGVSAAVQAARDHDIPRLAKEIDAAKKSGKLDDGEVEDIARALAKSEIREAKGDPGVVVIESMGECAESVEGALEDRSEKDDDVAAAAGALMLSHKLVSSDAYADFALEKDQRPLFRALGARSLVGDDDFVVVRLPLFRDLDEHVRLGALEAAEAFAVPGDFDELYEAARLDPLPSARHAAIRALGVLGGERVVRVLKDLWTTADAPARRAIAIAWATPKTFEAGGKEELLWAAQNTQGDGAIYASIALARVAADGTDERGQALGVLTRAIKLGTRSERVSAISMAPSSKDILDAIRFAKDDSDVGVSLVAWSRLHTEGTKDEVKTALDKLFDIAKGESPEAPRAQEELAWFGEKRVQPLLEKQLTSESPYGRVMGARGLIALDHFVLVAPNLGDPSSDVRVQTACAILGKRDR